MDRSNLSNIEQQISRVVLSSMLAGRFPREWSFESYNHYLQERGLDLRLFLARFEVANGPCLRQTVNEAVLRKYPDAFIKVYDTFLVCLFFHKSDQPLPKQEDLVRLLQNLLRTEDVVCYSSHAIRQVDQLIPAYHTLLKAAHHEQSFAGKYRDEGVLGLYALEDELTERILDGDLDAVEDMLTALYETVVANHKVFLTDEEDVLICLRSYFSFLWRYISRVVFERTGKRKTLRMCITLDLDLNMACRPEELTGWTLRFIEQMVDELNLTRKSNFHQMVETVKAYVRDNCMIDVSLNNVAEQVGLSSFYLSKLFKKETGFNFKDFTISVRMERAMQLLREGHMNVNEVASAVGYTNANYFSTAFHRYFGVTAKECITRYR